MKFATRDDISVYTYCIDDDSPVVIEYTLPTGFSEKAHAVWDYLEGAAYLFEHNHHLVITDESLDLEYEGCCGPRAVLDSWEEVETWLEENYEDLAEAGLL